MTLIRLGRWLFGRRTWLPLPMVAALLLVPASPRATWFSTRLGGIGVLVVLAGESMRLWAVHHIGAISRTRSDRLGPLIVTGPFSLVRNPLYLGNVAPWLGLALSARLFYVAPVIVALLTLEYHAIVTWEEWLLHERLGEPYRAYMQQVPRWVPRLRRPTPGAAPFSWRDTVFSERGTLIAIAAGYSLLWVKNNVW